MSFSDKEYKTKLNKRTNQRARSIFNGQDFTFMPIPERRGEDGELYKWEPEFGPLFKQPSGLLCANRKIATIPGFRLFSDFTRDFSYVTATLNAPEGYVARARFDYYNGSPEIGRHKVQNAFRIASDHTIGIKSAAKSRLRSEHEADLDETLDIDRGLKDLKTQHSATLPEAIRSLRSKAMYMTGIMAVERAGYEATHVLKDGIHTHLISYAGSFDLGACLDVRSINQQSPSIIGKRIEAELEASGLRSNVQLNRSEKVEIIEASMEEIEFQINELFEEQRLTNDPRCGLSKNGHATFDMLDIVSQNSLRELNAQPSSLLVPKAQQGLSNIFANKDTLLIAPNAIHMITKVSDAEAKHLIEQGMFRHLDAA